MDYRYTPNRVCLIDENNQILAETTFPDVDEHTVNINHTWVDPSLRGQHVGEKLLQIAAEQLRSSGKKVVITCPYALKWFSSHPEYEDLIR
jgi:predicted GNAT family acetyltransferase